MHAVFNVRSEPTAEDWLAEIFARNKLGMAMAAITRMIATTIKSSISEKPFCLRMVSPQPYTCISASIGEAKECDVGHNSLNHLPFNRFQQDELHQFETTVIM